MKKKGFTLVELLVVIAIIALLMGILMPALARVRMIAYRMICGTNLAGIGKAILLYTGDSKEAFPLPGVTNAAGLMPAGFIFNWCTVSGTNEAYGGPGSSRPAPFAGGGGTIGSVFYLLVRYEDTSVKQFNCKGDVGVKTFKLTDWSNTTYTAGCYVAPATSVEDFTKCWDFGRKPGGYCSYSYQMPYGVGTDNANLSPGFGPNASSPPSMPVAADRNPLLDTNNNYISAGAQGGSALTTGETTPWSQWTVNLNEYKDKDNTYNSFSHQREGQNVLYIDGHVSFSKTANCGINNDNIWQHWNQDGSQPTTTLDKKYREAGGYFPRKAWSASNTTAYFSDYTDTNPCGQEDAYLINESQATGTTPVP
jgi:prepilin-type N-terminal cleavage/methylation domain-containing protein/prepilin-type processing-associated H-X9-DG protein